MVATSHPLRRVTEPADQEESSEELAGRLNPEDQETPDRAPKAMREESDGRPWFSGLCADYASFKLDWEKYYGEQARSMPQAELVQRFGENCMNEKTAKHLKGASSMAEAWTMLDEVYYVA